MDIKFIEEHQILKTLNTVDVDKLDSLNVFISTAKRLHIKAQD